MIGGVEEEEQPSFIVSSCHLSISDYNFSQSDLDEEAKQKEVETRRARIKKSSLVKPDGK